MGAAKPLDKEIIYYLGHLSTEQKMVILSVVKLFAREEETLVDDKVYIAEMDRRFTELETSKVKGLTFDELTAKIRGKSA